MDIVLGKILSQFDKFDTGVDIGFRSISKKGKFTKEGSKKVVSPFGESVAKKFDEKAKDDKFIHGNRFRTQR
jgi:hypothetical protein